MIAVILGLVAVVLLVLMVVAIGMRSMNRRESNLPPERLKKMAEQAEDPNAKRPGRPAEETFFESFPEGFDAFQEPERATARLRPGGGKAGPRPAGRPGGRSAPRGKASHSARGRRGVDEWGDADDYDDDYWSRVRADDGAFGGTIAARVAASRPDLPTGSPDALPPAQKPVAKEKKEQVDAEATTVQAPLPTRQRGDQSPRPGRGGDQPSRPGRNEPAPVRASGPADQSPAAGRPSPGLADLVERPGSAASSDRTVTFPAPVAQQPPAASAADLLGAIGSAQPPAHPQAHPQAQSPAAPAPASGRTRRSPRPDPADPLGLADGRAKPRRRGEADPARGASRSGESRRSDSRRTPAGSTPPRGGAAARAADTGRTASGRGQGDPQSTRPAASPEDPLSSGSFPTGSVNHGLSPKNPLATGPVSGEPMDATRVTGPFEARPAYESASGPFAASGGQSGSYDPRGGRGGDVPSRQSWPAQPAYPAAGSYDILDGPEPAAGSNETWRAADYQLPSSEGGSYPARDAYTGETSYPAPASVSSYEVRPGWATIDDGDATVSAPAPSIGMPSTPARRGPDTPEPRQDGRQAGAAGTTSGSWPRPPQSPGGSWPSYSELYGNGADEPTGATPSRGGHHRVGDPEYPDYYR